MDNYFTFRGILTFITHVIAIVAIAWFIAWGFGKSYVMEGQSMQPTLEPEETVMVDRAIYHFKNPERYDIIAFFEEDFDADTMDDIKEDGVTPKLSIKRIIGLPGETVQIIDGKILIDGVELDATEELNIVPLAGIAAEPIKLEEDEYFILGDNRKASEDSRYENIGNVRWQSIIGKVWFRSKPLEKMGKIE